MPSSQKRREKRSIKGFLSRALALFERSFFVPKSEHAVSVPIVNSDEITSVEPNPMIPKITIILKV